MFQEDGSAGAEAANLADGLRGWFTPTKTEMARKVAKDQEKENVREHRGRNIQFAQRFEEYNLGVKDTITTRKLMNNLNKTEIGREIVEYIVNHPELRISMYYGIDNEWEVKGAQEKNEIILYASETKNVQETAEVRPVNNSSFDMVTDTDNPRNKAVRLAEKMLKKVQTDLPDSFEMPPVAVVDFEKQGLNVNAIGGYHEKTGMLFINSVFDTKEKILEFVNRNQGRFANTTEFAPYLHELGHKFYYGSIKSIEKANKISYSEAKRNVDRNIVAYIDNNCRELLQSKISTYANNGYLLGDYTEIVAECFSVKSSNSLANDIIALIEKIR